MTEQTSPSAVEKPMSIIDPKIIGTHIEFYGNYVIIKRSDNNWAEIVDPKNTFKYWEGSLDELEDKLEYILKVCRLTSKENE